MPLLLVTIAGAFPAGIVTAELYEAQKNGHFERALPDRHGDAEASLSRLRGAIGKDLLGLAPRMN